MSGLSPVIDKTIQEWEEFFSSLTDEELNTVALIRVIECSNGCAQHLFRDNSPDSFSLDETRTAMQYSMSGIKNWKFQIGDEVVQPQGQLLDALMEIRDLYTGAFKQGKKELISPFYRASIGSLKAVGNERIVNAGVKLVSELPEVFPPRMVSLGVCYIQDLVQVTPF